MTVAELIAKLQTFNPDCIVNVWGPDTYDGEGTVITPVTIVEFDLGGVIIK